MLINPIEFHVLVNRLHGAMEGAKEILRDAITEQQWDAGFEAEMARIKVRHVHALQRSRQNVTPLVVLFRKRRLIGWLAAASQPPPTGWTSPR